MSSGLTLHLFFSPFFFLISFTISDTTEDEAMGKGAGCFGSCRLAGSSADGLLGHVTITHNTSERGQLSDLAGLAHVSGGQVATGCSGLTLVGSRPWWAVDLGGLAWACSASGNLQDPLRSGPGTASLSYLPHFYWPKPRVRIGKHHSVPK